MSVKHFLIQDIVFWAVYGIMKLLFLCPIILTTFYTILYSLKRKELWQPWLENLHIHLMFTPGISEATLTTILITPIIYKISPS